MSLHSATTLADAIAKDLAPLGKELADRAVAYVLSGKDPSVLESLHGHAKDLALKTVAPPAVGRIREVFTEVELDADVLERLGRVYAASGAKGHIDQLEDLRWVEHLVWEAGPNAPNYSGKATLGIKLATLERAMGDPAPLVQVLLGGHTPALSSFGRPDEFIRYAFAQNGLGAPDVADFFARNSVVVSQVLREGEPTAISRLDEAKVPVAPFVATLAELASDPRVTLRRPAIKFLSRDADASRRALRRIADDEDRRPKQRQLAEKALEMIPADVVVTTIPASPSAGVDVPALPPSARQSLRGLCDEWLAQATPKYAVHVAQWPKAPRSWIEPIDDDTLANAVTRIEAKDPWAKPDEPLLARLQANYIVGLGEERIDEVLAHRDFAPVHVARVLALIGVNRDEWLVERVVSLLAKRRELGDSCTLEDAREAVRYAGLPPELVERTVLEGTTWGPEAEAEHLARRQEILEIVLGGRASSWFDRSHYWAGQLRKMAFKRVAIMDPALVLPVVREALWSIALEGGKAERPLAQACVVHLGDFEPRLIAALESRTADIRGNAAAWIARARISGARDALRRALSKEKTEVVRAALMTALEASGEPLDALMNRPGLGAKAEATLAKTKCPVLDWPEARAFPALHWADTGERVDGVIVRAWIAEAHKAKSPVPTTLFRLYARALREGEREAFARALLDAWLVHEGPITEKGVLAIVAAFGRDGIASRVGAYLKEFYGTRAAQCKALLQMLAHTDDKASTQLLLATATRFRTAGIRAEAELQAKELAERRGWTVDEMADRTIPTGGLDDDGTLTIAYGEGGRRFVVAFDDALRVTLRTPDGATQKSLPAPHKDEDEAAAKEAKAAFARARKEIESVVKMQRARLYEAMCTQRTWRYEDWRALLANHPIVMRLVRGVVWVAAQGDTETSFRPLEDGALSTADHRTLVLGPDAIVRVAHPLTMHDAHVADWTAHLGDFEVLPLFAQFGRKATVLDPSLAKSEKSDAFVGHMIEAFKLRARATALGYVRGPAEDGGWFYRYTKAFPSLGLQVELAFSGNELPETNRTVALGELSFERTGDDARTLRLGEVPAVLYSEVVADLEDIAQSGTGFDPAWQSKVP